MIVTASAFLPGTEAVVEVEFNFLPGVEATPESPGEPPGVELLEVRQLPFRHPGGVITLPADITEYRQAYPSILPALSEETVTALEEGLTLIPWASPA